MGKPKLVKSVKMNVDVISHGPSQGKTYKDENGRKVNVVNYVERNAFSTIFHSLLNEYSD